MTEHAGYECIDPQVGGELWRLEDPTTAAGLRARLETHVVFCASCRQQRAVEAATAAGIRARELTLGSTAGRTVRRIRVLGGVGALAMAASVALMLLLPPSPPSSGLVRGAEDTAAIERPVANEVVPGTRPTLRWTAIEGASSYRVAVSAVDGDYRWRAQVTDPSARLPEDRALPRGERYRVAVEPVPAHLAVPGGLRSTFRTGGAAAFLAYRVRTSGLASRIVGALGLAALVVAAVFERRRRSLASALDDAI